MYYPLLEADLLCVDFEFVLLILRGKNCLIKYYKPFLNMRMLDYSFLHSTTLGGFTCSQCLHNVSWDSRASNQIALGNHEVSQFEFKNSCLNQNHRFSLNRIVLFRCVEKRAITLINH